MFLVTYYYEYQGTPVIDGTIVQTYHGAADYLGAIVAEVTARKHSDNCIRYNNVIQGLLDRERTDMAFQAIDGWVQEFNQSGENRFYFTIKELTVSVQVKR